MNKFELEEEVASLQHKLYVANKSNEMLLEDNNKLYLSNRLLAKKQNSIEHEIRALFTALGILK